MGWDFCTDCGAPRPRQSLGGIVVCDRCADRRMAALTGLPELGEPPGLAVFHGPDGRRHELAVRCWRAPTGIVVELEERGVPVGEGYQFSVLGAHDADVGALTSLALARADRVVARPPTLLYPGPQFGHRRVEIGLAALLRGHAGEVVAANA